MAIRIVTTSDLHGNLPYIRENFDLMLICGDLCPTVNHDAFYQEGWLRTAFVEWVNSICSPLSTVVAIPGNHDYYLEMAKSSDINDLKWMCGHRLRILRHELHQYLYSDDSGETHAINIFGTPYCSRFGSWAFMREDKFLSMAYDHIPDETDILISHDAPNIYGLGDITEGRHKQSGTGNPLMTETLRRVRPYIFHCGHFHSGNHEFAEHEGIWMSNVSLVNERYEPVNPLLCYSFDPVTKKVIL